ncbi:MAG: hypothetical protein AB1Z98_15840, partial [Nannocystaceae bacterium]
MTLLLGCEIDLGDPELDGGTGGTGDATGDTGADETAGVPSIATCADVDRSAEGQPLPLEGPEIALSGVYRVAGRMIYDAGQIVTVAPGTVFLMEPDAMLYFGWRGDPATVYAEGTEQEPILFCGTAAGPGHWTDLQLLSGTTTDSVLSYVRIEDAGASQAPALLLTVDATLDHVTIEGNDGPGFRLEGLADDSDQLVSTGNGGVSGTVVGQSAISNLPPGNYSGNGEDVLLVEALSNTTTVLHERGVAYRQLEDRVVFGRADGVLTSLTVEAGVEYQFCQDCFMLVGWRSDPAVIDVQGTAEAPVTFTSSRSMPAAGDWNGLSLLTGTRSDSIIDHARFEYGGKVDGGNLIIGGGLGTVRNTTLVSSAGWGVLVEGAREPGLVLEG